MRVCLCEDVEHVKRARNVEKLKAGEEGDGKLGGLSFGGWCSGTHGHGTAHDSDQVPVIEGDQRREESSVVEARSASPTTWRLLHT